VSDTLIFHWHFVQLLDLGSLIDVGDNQEFVRAKHFQIVCRRRIIKVLILLFLLRVALVFVIDFLYIFFLLILLSLFVIFLWLAIIVFFLFFFCTA
jgi:hypothetical protein